MTTLSHTDTDDIVCPYCGCANEQTDYVCDGNMEGEENCSECGKMYSFSADVTITFSTSKIEDSADEDA